MYDEVMNSFIIKSFLSA